MRLLLDECAAAQSLIERLRNAGHDVATSVELLGSGAPDAEIFELAKRQRRVLLTRDCRDFLLLHVGDPKHNGLLLIYEDGDERDMTPSQIAAAIAQLEQSTAPLKGRCITLNLLRHR
jgi:predicted nuclease of predicted toxin-antitoxin system